MIYELAVKVIQQHKVATTILEFLLSLPAVFWGLHLLVVVRRDVVRGVVVMGQTCSVITMVRNHP